MQLRSYALIGLLSFAAAPHVARDVTIHGRVTEAATGKPLASANVTIQTMSVGAITDSLGMYSFIARGVGNTVTLRVRRIGYAATTLSVSTVGKSDIVVNIALKNETVSLNEVVVTSAPVTRSDKWYAKILKAPAAPALGGTVSGIRTRSGPWNTESYSAIEDNPFFLTGERPLSTFSVDVDRASYSNVRRFLREGNAPPKDAVRIEEMINYFPYAYPNPEGREPVSITTRVGAAPWNSSHRLVMVGLKARPIATASLPPNNLVFLLDVSGSMSSPDKLPLVKSAFELLVDQLRPQDRVAIVVYAGSAGLVLPSTSGAERSKILEAITRLEAGGSTAGGEGLRLAYSVARRNFNTKGNNRVILATDGDFNVGVSSDAEMVRLIEQERESGVFLSVLGFGTGNLKDSKMEQMADKGNGHFAYIDNILEAKKVFVSELGATLRTVAKDVKLQIEFNPRRVAAYRLIGYENRLLNDQDFDDDRKDAGDMGAGHTVTAFYEVIPVGVTKDPLLPKSNDMRYRKTTPASGDHSEELLYVKLRYKEPDARTSQLMTRAVQDNSSQVTGDFAFATAVAEFGMLLRQSKFRGNASWGSVIRVARRNVGEDRDGLRSEFVSLVETASRISAVAVR